MGRHPRRWALLALCVVHDLWLWSRLRAGRGPGVRWRVAADLVDATVWSLLGWAHYPHTAAVMVVIPLVAFVSARRLSTGLVLTAVTIGVTAAARSLVGSEPYLVVTTGFVLIGVLLGRSLVWLVAEEVRRHEALVERSAQASLAAARLAGRNAVVTGVGAEAIDQLGDHLRPGWRRGGRGDRAAQGRVPAQAAARPGDPRRDRRPAAGVPLPR